MITSSIPLTELTTTTIQLLCREIGVVNTARFINQFTIGYGNYTEDRDQFVGEASVDEIVTEIQLRRRDKNRDRHKNHKAS